MPLKWYVTESFVLFIFDFIQLIMKLIFSLFISAFKLKLIEH